MLCSTDGDDVKHCKSVQKHFLLQVLVQRAPLRGLERGRGKSECQRILRQVKSVDKCKSKVSVKLCTSCKSIHERPSEREIISKDIVRRGECAGGHIPSPGEKNAELA